MEVDSDNNVIKDVREAAESGGDNLLDRLRERRNQIASKDEYRLDLPVPGYDGELVVRYKYTEYNETAERADRLRGVDAGQVPLISAIDTLIAACDKVMIVVNGRLVPIDEGALTPVRFEERLADILAFNASKARDVVRGLFNNDYAIIEQAMTVSRWMRDVTKKVDEAYVGE